MDERTGKQLGFMLLAQQALTQVLYRSWGGTKEDLRDNLERTKQVLIQSAASSPDQQLQVSCIENAFAIALHSVEAAIQGLPDDR